MLGWFEVLEKKWREENYFFQMRDFSKGGIQEQIEYNGKLKTEYSNHENILGLFNATRNL